jgi:hypothetical protein
MAKKSQIPMEKRIKIQILYEEGPTISKIPQISVNYTLNRYKSTLFHNKRPNSGRQDNCADGSTKS